MENERHSWLWMTALLCVVFAFSGSAGAKTYYVSAVSGDDANAGSREAPFASMSKAAEIAEAGDTCRVMPGIYRETVRPARSGKDGRPITFRADSGEPVLVSGTEVVTGWERWKGDIYRAEVKHDISQVFVDGKMVLEARWPNAGQDPLRAPYAEADKGAGNTTLTDQELDQPDGFWNGARIHLLPGHHWISWTREVKEHDAAKNTLTFERYASVDADAYRLNEGTVYYLSGKLGALDRPGEWYYDHEENYLYLQAPNAGDPKDHIVEVKARDLAFDLSGRSHIRVTGFRVFGAAMSLADAQNCTVENCHLKYVSHFVECRGWGTGMDDSGVVISGSHNEFRRCSVAWSAGNGVTLLGTDNSVVDCLIHDVDYAAVDCGAIRAKGKDLLVKKNTLHDGARSILLNRHLESSRITYNHMYNAGLVNNDLGVTYCFQTDGKGTVIAYNRVHHNRAPLGVGIYIDNGSPNHVIHHNISYHNTDSGIRLNTPTANIKVFNNTCWNNGDSMNWWGPNNNSDMPDTLVANNILPGEVRLGKGARAHHNYRGDGPGFVNADEGDFRLRADSPCVDAGVGIEDITGEIIGDAPDLGARERGGRRWKAGHTWGSPPAVWFSPAR